LPIGWTLAIATHSLHNALAAASAKAPESAILMFLTDWTGWVFFAALVVWCIWREKRLLRRNLADEVQRGWLTEDQLRTATSGRARAGARVRAALAGKLKATRRFYDLCGELAHKKNQLARYGEEDGNTARVEALRQELVALAPQVA
jgi:hypothetical protein